MQSSQTASRGSQPRVIALLGVDGVGKTTTAKAVVRALSDSGVPARYFENAEIAQHRVLLRGRDEETIGYIESFDAAYRALP